MTVFFWGVIQTTWWENLTWSDGMREKTNPFLIESVKHYPQASGLQHLAVDLVPVMQKHRQLVLDYDGEMIAVNLSKSVNLASWWAAINRTCCTLNKKRRRSAFVSLRKAYSSPALWNVCSESITMASYGELLSCWIIICKDRPGLSAVMLTCTVLVHKNFLGRHNTCNKNKIDLSHD